MAYYRSKKRLNISSQEQTGSIVTFNSQYAGLPLKFHKIALTATQSGSGTPSPSNPRSISGWSKIRIGQLGNSPLNSYFEGLYNGTYGFVDLGSLTFGYNTTYSAFYASVPNIYRPSDIAGRIIGFINMRYPASPNGAISAMDDKSCLRYNGNFWVKDTSFTDATALKTSLNGVYLIYELKTPTTPTITDAQFDTLLTDFGVSGSMFTIQIGSTVYGGEYDARTGVLTAPVNGVDMGSLTWTIQDVSGDVTRFISNSIADMKSTTTRTMDIICSMFKTNKSIPEPYMDNAIYNGANVKQLIVATSAYSDLSSFTTAVNGQIVVYELATPQTIQLPPCPIDTLEGVNNIWADTGETTVEYIKIQP